MDNDSIVRSLLTELVEETKGKYVAVAACCLTEDGEEVSRMACVEGYGMKLLRAVTMLGRAQIRQAVNELPAKKLEELI